MFHAYKAQLPGGNRLLSSAAVDNSPAIVYSRSRKSMIEARFSSVGTEFAGSVPVRLIRPEQLCISVPVRLIRPEQLCIERESRRGLSAAFRRHVRSGASENIRCTATGELSMTGPGLVESCQAYGKEEIFLFCEVMTVMISHSRRFFSFCMERIER